MKAVEFHSELRPDSTLHVPDDVAGRIPLGQRLRVLILIPEDSNDQKWEQLAAHDFGQGYANCDSIYDQLSSAACNR